MNEKKNVYIKKNVSFHEYNMHKIIYQLSINSKLFSVPEIVDYNSTKKIMTMIKVEADNISNNYGETLKDIPKNIIKQIKQIIKFLKTNGIIYPDITGYNFIYDKEKIWLIDFEHSYFDGFEERNDPFIKWFIQSGNEWNPNFI